MNSVFVLIMLFSSGGVGISNITQEFTSLEKCEYALKQISQAHNGRSVVLQSQGCFKK